MKETWDKTIAASTEICARAEDLVAYLYGEAPAAEGPAFEKHVQNCASCRAELSAFGNVREAIGEWRQQALGALVSPSQEAKAATITAPAKEPSSKRLSALAAIRAFFTLSPAWVRAATAVAALVFCALAAIAVAHFAQQPKVVVVEKTVQTGYSEKDVKAKIAEALNKQQEEQNVQPPAPPSRNFTIAQKRPAVTIQPARNNPQVALKGKRQAMPRRYNTPTTELVRMDDAYLPFTASKAEEKLPSLSDLVSDDN